MGVVRQLFAVGDAVEITSVAEAYLDERVRTGEISPLSARNHRSTLRGFAQVIAQTTTLARVGRDDLERWMEARSHLKPSTRRSEWSTVKTFLSWAVRKGHCRENPALVMRAPRQPRSVPRALSADQVTKLLRTCPDRRARAICFLMVGMGLRCGEVAGLHVSDWDRGRAQMFVRGKGSHERTVCVPAEVELVVDDYLDEHPTDAGPLIRCYLHDGTLPLTGDFISGVVSEWLRAAGVKQHSGDGVSAHSLRHTAASDVLDAGGDLRIVQEMLGHQHMSTTAIYLRRAGLRRMREAMAGRSYGYRQSAPSPSQGGRPTVTP